MSSVFSRIIAREIPSYRIDEDDRFFAFLDIHPIAQGHTLVVPKQEVDYVFDLDDETLGDLLVFAKRVAHALQQAIACKRVGVAIIGLEVPHAHVHLVPLQDMHDIDFSKPKLKFSAQQFESLAASVRAHL